MRWTSFLASKEVCSSPNCAAGGRPVKECLATNTTNAPCFHKPTHQLASPTLSTIPVSHQLLSCKMAGWRHPGAAVSAGGSTVQLSQVGSRMTVQARQWVRADKGCSKLAYTWPGQWWYSQLMLPSHWKEGCQKQEAGLPTLPRPVTLHKMKISRLRAGKLSATAA